MEYLYYFTNVSLTLRLVEYLQAKPELSVLFVTVIHEIDGWVVRIKLTGDIAPENLDNFRAFIDELAILYKPSKRLKTVLSSLEEGQSIISIMRRYQVAVVCHGSPNKKEIEAFRENFVRKLGYCPETLM